ncbi:MAG: winged helix-turn-helix domain-containing protein [Aggregatilineales bacterium]
MPELRTLTVQDVRRLAISKQHLSGAAVPDMLSIIRDLGCLQLDPISAVAKNHWLILWSRLGNYDRADFEQLIWEDRSLFEYWAHQASIVLTDDYPIHNYRMRHYPNQRSAWGRRLQAWMDDNRSTVQPLQDDILGHIREHGATGSKTFKSNKEVEWQSSGWTAGKATNKLIDYLWMRGILMVAGRKGNQRLWDLAERHLPDWTPRSELTQAQVMHHATQKALQVIGVGTEKHIKYQYIRNRYHDMPETLQILEDEKLIERVQVIKNDETLKGDWYLHTDDIALVEQIQSGDWQPRTALLSPFDNLICERDRTELLWDFHYRMEIYVPKNKRQYGYYVLPLLHGDSFIGRVDAKFDKKTKILHFPAIHAEDDAPHDAETIKNIRAEFTSLANWLGATAIDYGTVPAQWADLASS